MRAPKGFGKNYFSLAAIQAHSSAVVLHSASVRATECLQNRDRESESEAEAEENPDALLCSAAPKPASHPSGSRHCNCYFIRKTRNTIKNHPLPKQFIPPFELNNSTLSPP